MRKKNFKGRCEKKSVPECNEIFKVWNQYLHNVEVVCQRLEDELLIDAIKTAGVTEELKCRDSMEWVGKMNVVRMEVEREVVKKLIFVE